MPSSDMGIGYPNVGEVLALKPIPSHSTELVADVIGRPLSPVCETELPVVANGARIIPISATQQLLNDIGPTDNICFQSPAPNLVNHLKRLAVSELPRPWKKYIQSKAVTVTDDVSIVVQHKNGKLWVSPQKKRIGRPPGSKNRPKSIKQLVDEGLILPEKKSYTSKVKKTKVDGALVIEKVAMEMDYVGVEDHATPVKKTAEKENTPSADLA